MPTVTEAEEVPAVTVAAGEVADYVALQDKYIKQTLPVSASGGTGENQMVMMSGGQQVVMSAAGEQQILVMQGEQPSASVRATTSDAAMAMQQYRGIQRPENNVNMSPCIIGRGNVRARRSVMRSEGQQVVMSGAGEQHMVVMQGEQHTASVRATTSDAAMAMPQYRGIQRPESNVNMSPCIIGRGCIRARRPVMRSGGQQVVMSGSVEQQNVVMQGEQHTASVRASTSDAALAQLAAEAGPLEGEEDELMSGGQQVVMSAAGEQQMVVKQGEQPTASVGATASDGSVTTDAAVAQLAVEASLLEGEGEEEEELGEGMTLQLEEGVLEHRLPVPLGGFHGEIDILNKRATIYLDETKEYRFNANGAGAGPMKAVLKGGETYIRKEEGGVWVVGVTGKEKSIKELIITWGEELFLAIEVKCVEQEQSLKIGHKVVGRLIGILEIIRQENTNCHYIISGNKDKGISIIQDIEHEYDCVVNLTGDKSQPVRILKIRNSGLLLISKY